MFKRIKGLLVKAECTLRKRTAGAKLNLFKKTFSLACAAGESNANRTLITIQCVLVASHVIFSILITKLTPVRRSFASHLKFSF